MELDNDLSNAGEYSRLSNEIEEVARQLCLLGTNLTEDELIDFLDIRQSKNKGKKFYDYDLSLLVNECNKFIDYTDENEINNDCSTEEQMFINAAYNIDLAYDLLKDK